MQHYRPQPRPLSPPRLVSPPTTSPGDSPPSCQIVKPQSIRSPTGSTLVSAKKRSFHQVDDALYDLQNCHPLSPIKRQVASFWMCPIRAYHWGDEGFMQNEEKEDSRQHGCSNGSFGRKVDPAGTKTPRFPDPINGSPYYDYYYNTKSSSSSSHRPGSNSSGSSSGGANKRSKINCSVLGALRCDHNASSASVTAIQTWSELGESPYKQARLVKSPATFHNNSNCQSWSNRNHTSRNRGDEDIDQEMQTIALSLHSLPPIQGRVVTVTPSPLMMDRKGCKGSATERKMSVETPTQAEKLHVASPAKVRYYPKQQDQNAAGGRMTYFPSLDGLKNQASNAPLAQRKQTYDMDTRFTSLGRISDPNPDPINQKMIVDHAYVGAHNNQVKVIRPVLQRTDKNVCVPTIQRPTFVRPRLRRTDDAAKHRKYSGEDATAQEDISFHPLSSSAGTMSSAFCPRPTQQVSRQD